MGTKEKALAASGTVPTLQNTSLWLWGHHFCKIKCSLDASLCRFLFLFVCFFIQRISVESDKGTAAASATQLWCPL